MNYCHPAETRQKFGQCQIRHILQNEPEPTAFQRPMRARNSTSSSSSSSGKADSSSATGNGSSSSSSNSSKKKLTPAQHYAKDLSMASALSSVWTYNRDLCGNLTGPAVPDESSVQSTTAISGSSSSSSSSTTNASGRAAAARAAAAAAGTTVPTKASATIAAAAAAAEQVYTGSKLLCQCSSIGSLKAGWLNTFYENFTVKAGTSSGATASTSKSTDALDMQIVWPTAASIRGSLRGWSSGGSIPCQPTSMFEVRTACHIHTT
jgi:Tyrosyl-DNA phosphodiesterase